MTEETICEQLLKTLESTLKRHRGKPLQMETKRNIVADLLRQQSERTELMRTNHANDERIRQQSHSVTA